MQLVSALGKYAVQPVGIEGVEDFGRVGFAHGGDRRGGLYAALHIVHAAVVEHERVRPFGQSHNVCEQLRAVLALELDVVDGEHRLDVAVFVRKAVIHVEINGRERGLPVVAVQHVGEEADERKHFGDSLREIRETLAVVKVPVQPPALEIKLVVDEIIGYSVVNRFVNPRILPAPAEVHERRTDKTHTAFERILDFLLVVRKNDSRVVTELFERFRQRARHVAQTSRSRKRSRFRRYE